MMVVFDAIKTKKGATSSLNSVNGPFLGFAADRTAYPYMVVVPHFGGSSEYAFRDLLFERGFVRIVALDDSAADLKTIADNIEAAFNAQPTTLTTDAGTLLSFRRVRPWVIEQNEVAKSPTGVPIFQAYAEFEFFHHP